MKVQDERDSVTVKNGGRFKGAIRIPLRSLSLSWNNLALPRISRKSLKFLALLLSIPTAPTKPFYSEWHPDLTAIGPNSWSTVRCVLNGSRQHLATHFLKRVRRFPTFSVRLSAAVASAPQPVLHSQQFRDSLWGRLGSCRVVLDPAKEKELRWIP